MINESLYFMFNNRKSTDFKLLNISVNSGLFEESLLSRRSIVEQKVKDKPKPYFNRVDREPITINLSFYFEETWNDELIDDTCEWLDVDYYQPLSFSSNFDRIFYAMPVEDFSLIHNGLKQGYVRLNMRCDSPFAYGKIIEDTHDFTLNSGINSFVFENKGALEIKPILEFTKIGTGNISIQNFSKADSHFLFTNITNGEILTVDCAKRYIDSSLDLSRYDDFNQNYLSIPKGLNQFQIVGSCVMKIKYQFTYRALTL